MKNIEEPSIRCNMCDWIGTEEDLIRLTDEEDTLDGCPKCKTDNYLMDLTYPPFLTEK